MMFDKQQINAMRKRAQAPYGIGWKHLSDDTRDAVYAREAMMALLAQCEVSAVERGRTLTDAQDLVREVYMRLKEDNR